MSESSEIREWAREAGLDVPVKGPLPAHIREAWAGRAELEEDDEAPVIIGAPFVGATAGPVSSSTDGSVPSARADAIPAEPRRPEVRPQGKRVSAADRFRQRVASSAKKPRKRVSIEDVVSSIWGLGGMALMQNPATVPVGRVVMVQAGVAGVVVEDVAKGTIVDRVLQPLARMEESSKAGFALIGPPLLVGLITARPELGPAIRPVLKASMMTWIEISAPAIEKAQKKAQKWTEQFGDIDLDAVIDSFWSTEGLPVAESEDEENAIRRARGDG